MTFILFRKRKSLSLSHSSALDTMDEEKQPLTTAGASEAAAGEKLIEEEETMTGNVSTIIKKAKLKSTFMVSYHITLLRMFVFHHHKINEN